MRFKKMVVLSIALIMVYGCNQSTDSTKLTPVPFSEVNLEDNFWKPRLKTQAETLVPFALDKTKPALKALEQAGNFLAGIEDDIPKPHRFQSSDLYKVMEGAALILAENPDPELEARMDKIIDIIAKAQKEDGYLYVAHITGSSKNHSHWDGGGMGDKPYSFVLHSHELYNMGHMYEGAIAYYQATGKDKWLKVAEKSAQHINKVFFEGDPNYNDGKPVNQAPGHQEPELALVKLYRVTDNPLYLEMARKFLDIRGITYKPDGEGVMSATYSHQHKPVAEQTRAVGHAVRATYLYSGMADVGALTGSNKYDKALDAIWHNIVDTKMHITGGLGAVHGIEGFGPEYVLPNKEAYNETCAAVGNVLFNYRLFLLHKDANYMDVAEVSLLNNSLAGVNFEGNKFFYVNPLEADGSYPFNHGKAGRSPWFGTACCPSNIARLIPQVSGMMYAHSDDEIYVPFYASNSTSIPLQEGTVAINQKSNYPFDENVELTVNPEEEQQFTIKLRIPTWAREQFVPGKLYNYIGDISEEWHVKVNGERADVSLDKGFAVIDRNWSPNDKVELHLPMPLRFNRSLDKVQANVDRIAITRGPLVYCAEGPDNNGSVQRFFMDNIPDQKEVKTDVISDGILNGVVSVSLPGKSSSAGGINDENISLIPYYAWNNRGDESMVVWLPTKSDMIIFPDGDALKGGIYKSVKASSNSDRSNLGTLQKLKRPINSADRTIHAWISDPDEKKSWVEVGLDKSKQIRSVNVYWFDFRNRVKVPLKWSMEYLKDGKWQPFKIYVTDSYSTDKDQYNVVHPAEKLNCDGIRIRMESAKGTSVGILDLDIVYENITDV